MKKIIKIVLTLLFISLLVFSINGLIFNFSDEGLAFTILAFVLFVMHLFAWIAPKKFFDLCRTDLYHLREKYVSGVKNGNCCL